VTALADKIKGAADSLVEAIEQHTEQLEQSRYGYRDHQAQIFTVDASIGGLRREVLDRLDAMERKLAAGLDEITQHLRKLTHQLGTNGSGGDNG
jgi:hypothetical protein